MSSHASSSKSALSPARARISSTSHRCRPTPGTGSGADGSTETRQRVVAAVGWPKSAASVCRRQRRSAMPDRAGPLGRELQPARGRHRQARRPRRPPPRGRHAAGPPPCRPAPSCRRRPRHRSPGREPSRPGPAPARRDRAAQCTTAPCLSCARRCRRRRARPRRRRSRRCRRRRPHAGRRAPSRRRGDANPPRRSRREAPISGRRLRPSIFSICARSDSMADTARKLHRDLPEECSLFVLLIRARSSRGTPGRSTQGVWR